MIKKSIRYLKQYGIKNTLARSYLELNQISKKCLASLEKKTSYGNGSSEVLFGDEKYRLWIEKNEADTHSLLNQQNLSKKFKFRPTVSIITPVFNPDKKVFIKIIESVINQTYDNWELCLADGSSESYIKDIVEAYKKEDKRIKVKYLKENYGIAKNSNEALSLATGDFVALLDHDDILAPFALFEVANVINGNPDVEFIYSDRDKISDDGKRFDPFFKPDWSPDYLLAQNYLCHLNVIRKTLIDNIGGFREGYDGSQDYDLVLRVTELTDKIIHIPKILYHWRMTAQSAAIGAEAKPYAYEAAKRALSDAMNRRGIEAVKINGSVRGMYRIKYPIREPKKVSIIIPTKDKVNVFKKCIDSIIAKTSYGDYEILLVDNQSEESKTFEYYEKIKDNDKIRVIIYDKPFNYSAINNYAASQCDDSFLLFLNNDVEVISPKWIEAMIEFAQRKDVGVVGAKLFYPNNTIQHAGVILGIGGVAGHLHKYFPRDSFGAGDGMRLITVQNFSAVTGACMMIRREVFEEVGGFDEGFSHTFNDVDLCMKIRQRGYLIIWTPYAELYHHESKSRGYEDTPGKQMRFKREIELFRQKWGHLLEKGDPYYNPNLTLDKEDFSIKI